jgi:ActR/RegA family two-component response regulator
MESIVDVILADYFRGVLQREFDKAPKDVRQLPSLEHLVDDYIFYLLRLTSNNVSMTARILKISRSTLTQRLRRARG